MRGAHASVCKSARSHYSLLDFMYPTELIRDTFPDLITFGYTSLFVKSFLFSLGSRARKLENNAKAD